MKVSKAVIVTAGYSTRFLPVCKNVPKPMLPLLEVPIIHEQVKECIEGGITDVILVTSYGNNSLEDYFDNRADLEAFLEKTGKLDRYKRFDEVFGKVNTMVVRQNKRFPYGSGSPILAAKPWLNEGEPFAVMYGDDLVLSETSAIGQLKKDFEARLEKDKNVSGVIGTQNVEREEVFRYGIVKFKDEKENLIDTIVEKPSVEDAPSTLASYGRYVVSYDVFKYLDPNNLVSGELFFSKAVDELCRAGNVYSYVVDGEWLTTGDPLNYIKATLKYAMKRDEYRNELKKFITEL